MEPTGVVEVLRWLSQGVRHVQRSRRGLKSVAGCWPIAQEVAKGKLFRPSIEHSYLKRRHSTCRSLSIIKFLPDCGNVVCTTLTLRGSIDSGQRSCRCADATGKRPLAPPVRGEPLSFVIAPSSSLRSYEPALRPSQAS